MQKIINTILEMFEQRGYSDIKENNQYITAINNDNNIIRVNLNIIQKLNIAEINSIVHNLQDNNISHCIVIFQGIPTPSVKNLILSLPELNLNIELFKAEDLFFNITKHILVPNHEKLNKQEQIQFKKSFGINIPVLLKTDPISKFYNFKRGDIIKVTRKNGFISYRIVK